MVEIGDDEIEMIDTRLAHAQKLRARPLEGGGSDRLNFANVSSRGGTRPALAKSVGICRQGWGGVDEGETVGCAGRGPSKSMISRSAHGILAPHSPDDITEDVGRA